jgi:glycosyltransferase involved in cell wall biosynthesis
MKILMLTFSFPHFNRNGEGAFYGGSFLLPEAKAYERAGAQVTVLTMHAPGLPFIETVSKGIQIVRVPYFIPVSLERVRIPNHPLYTKKLWWLRLFQLPLFLLAYLIFLIFYGRQTDIIHANWTPTAFMALAVKFLFGKPVFLTFRGSDLTRLPEVFNRFTIRMMDGVFHWKLGDVVRYIEKFKGPYISLPLITSIDPRQLETKEKWQVFSEGEGVFRYLFVGRLTFDSVQLIKGLDILLPAVELLANRVGDSKRFRLDVLGDGPARKRLEEKSKSLGIDSHVTFHGHQEDVASFLSKSHAVIGGIGLNAVVQEAAMSKCLLMVANGEEWCGDIWQDGINSLVYTPHNAVSLSDALYRAICMPGESKYLSENGSKTISHYTCTSDEAGKKYIDCFNRLIGRKIRRVSL